MKDIARIMDKNRIKRYIHIGGAAHHAQLDVTNCDIKISNASFVPEIESHQGSGLPSRFLEF
jgi:hypothetical protein